MEKKNINTIVTVVSVLAVCIVAVVCTLLVINSGSLSKKSEKDEKTTVQSAEEETTNAYVEDSLNGVTVPESTTGVPDTSVEGSTEINTDAVPGTVPVTYPVANNQGSNNGGSSNKPGNSGSNKPKPVTPPATEMPTQAVVIDKEENVTIPHMDKDSMSEGEVVKPPAAEPTDDLPKDMTFTGLYRMGYDVFGLKKYIYNDDTDPECIQANFGYNRLYDWGAQLIDFSIDTARMPFVYGDKEYMIQIWKGQYISGEMGTVGGEVGLYTRPKGTVSAIGHYSCAEYEDWLNMEMTILWDEDGSGNYLPQLTRVYKLHWWPTGFVFGQLANKRDTDPLRVLCRITFKDDEMAQAFAASLSNEGFSSVSEFDPTVKDTYKIHGKDVIFIWQDVR